MEKEKKIFFCYGLMGRLLLGKYTNVICVIICFTVNSFISLFKSHFNVHETY